MIFGFGLTRWFSASWFFSWIVWNIRHVDQVLIPFIIPCQVIIVRLLTTNSSQNGLNYYVMIWTITSYLPDFRGRRAKALAVLYICWVIFAYNDSNCRLVPYPGFPTCTLAPTWSYTKVLCRSETLLSPHDPTHFLQKNSIVSFHYSQSFLFNLQFFQF